MTERLGLNGMTQEDRRWYDMVLLRRALPELVYLNYGKKSPLPARGGSSVQWRRLETISASTTALTEGTPPSATNVTVTQVTATVQQYGQFARHSEVLATQGIDPIITEMVAAFGEAMKNSLDQVARNAITGGTTVQYASTAASRAQLGSGMRLTLAEIREGTGTARRNNAAPVVDGKYAMIIHTDTEEDLFADSDIQTIFQDAGVRGGGNPLFTGVLGDIAGVRIIVTSNGRIFSSAGLSGADVYGTMIIGKDFYGVTEFSAHAARTYIKAPGSGGTSDPLDQFGTVGYKASLAVARLNENFGVRIEHTTSQSNAA